MANTAGGDKIKANPWAIDQYVRLPWGPPAASVTVYAGQAVLRDGNGNLSQCDDTGKGEFVGIVRAFVRSDVNPADLVQTNGLAGDKQFDIEQPRKFNALIAAAAAGDEGRKVYWKFNNEVSYSPGTNGNYAGWVWQVLDATHVIVACPWLDRPVGGGMKSNLALSATAATVTLTKWDVNRTFQLPATANQTVVLPPVAKCSSGDRLCFIYTGTLLRQMTLQGNAAELINGANTLLLGTAQYSRATVETDGVVWLQVA